MKICLAIWILLPVLCTAWSVSASTHNHRPVQYVEVTLEAGIDFRYINGATGEKYMPESMGSGAAFFDFDGDGLLDLYIINGAYFGEIPPGESVPVNAMFRNLGDGTFVNVTEQTGTGDPGYGMGVAVGDVNNNGILDLYVANYGANVFYRNRGDGTFEDVTEQTGTGDPGWGSSAAFTDYNNNGYLDLYVANYMDFRIEDNKECRQSTVHAYCGPLAYPGQSGVLYRNDGDWAFTDVTREAGVYSTAGRQLAVIFGDYNNNGYQDFFIANDKAPNFLFRNNMDGTFEEIGVIAGVAFNEDGVAESAMGADWGDYDNDGHLDIIMATFQWLANTLYRNEGDGFFMDMTYPARLGTESLPYLGMTAAFLDYDNDGWLDVFLANGHLDENVQEYDSAASYEQLNQLFRNQGDGTFTEVTQQAGPGLQVERVSHGAAFGDFNNDGYIDIFISDSDTPHCTLLLNQGGSGNHWLMIRTVGLDSNRDGIGARVWAYAGELEIMKEVRSAYGYMGANDLRLHFGLGSSPRAERLEIRWPSGKRQVLKDVSANQLVVIHEPAGF